MKKNKRMRTASGLMIAALLTTSMISGTFAKYTTADAAQDSARAAKWGVNLGISGSLYGDAYAGADSNTIVSNTDSSVTVKSSAAGTDVIAPGTRNSNSGLHITLNGTPEVSTRVYGTIKTQNIYLKKGEYGVMVEAHDVKAEDFANGGNEYYTETGGAYEKAKGYIQGVNYYTLENAANVDANYYPVVYSGAKVTGSKTKDSLSEIGQNIANLLADFQYIHLRKHQVQKDNIVFFIFCFLYCFFSVIGAVYLIAILFQTEPDPFYDQFFIIYY